MSRVAAGSIVLVDFRGRTLPNEPTKIRPAVVVEDDGIVEYPNTIVVPLTSDEHLAHPTFAERIDPAPENGATLTCWALAHHVQSISEKRIVKRTASNVTQAQLHNIRERIAIALGIETL